MGFGGIVRVLVVIGCGGCQYSAVYHMVSAMAMLQKMLMQYQSFDALDYTIDSGRLAQVLVVYLCKGENA